MLILKRTISQILRRFSSNPIKSFNESKRNIKPKGFDLRNLYYVGDFLLSDLHYDLNFSFFLTRLFLLQHSVSEHGKCKDVNRN